MLALADAARQMTDRDFGPLGYNLGINVDEVAGQTVAHVDLHLFPRYPGDGDRPCGEGGFRPNRTTDPAPRKGENVEHDRTQERTAR